MTKFAQRKQQHERKQAAKAIGNCLKCFDKPAGVNLNGLKSAYCDGCRPSGYPKTGKPSAGQALQKPKVPQPNMTREWGTDDSRGYLESKEFARYTVQIHQIIKRHHGITLAAIGRELGDDRNQNWDADAISALLAVAEIEPGWVIPPRYTAVTPRIRVTGWNRGIGKFSPKTRPHNEVFEDNRRKVTA